MYMYTGFPDNCSKIHDLFALKYKALPHLFAVITAINVSSIGVFTNHSALYKSKKLVTHLIINSHFIAISISCVLFLRMCKHETSTHIQRSRSLWR